VDKMMGPQVIDMYSAQEEDFLANTNIYDAESDEEASSGDDDALTDIKELLVDDYAPRSNFYDEKKYMNLMEPLFTPIGADVNAASGGMSVGGVGVGKLPFNRRKIRYFDCITAQDTMAARAYLQQEMQQSKKREVLMLAQHLKRAQRIQRRQLKEKRGQPLDSTDLSDGETSEDPSSSRSLMPSSVSKLEETMTPAVAAALVIESLELNPLESIEGMAKCYDGIVAAGVALLEISVSDPTMTPSSETSGGSHVTRSEIMAALAPLLITSLEQPSGDVIISLAKMRRMCGTPRYQRRFVQRVAPALIRPPRGAMWCLRHQNDMEPILAAAELIFDSAFDIFSKGWYDRGQLLLADTKRAETLSAAAMQLKNLSSNPQENLTLDLGHNTWRSNKYMSGKDGTKGAKEPLAEWEVIAVDRQIRVSISNIISMDWSRVVVHSRESSITSASYHHRSRQSSKRPSALLQATSSGDMSPKNNISSSPMSPVRSQNLKTQQSSPGFGGEFDAGSATTPSHFPPSDASRERAKSPVPSPSTSIPLSPPPPNRTGADDIGQNSSNLFPPTEHTPPRSPTPKTKEFTLDTAQAAYRASSAGTSNQVKESISNVPDNVPSPSPMNTQFGGDNERAPLSPLSVGTAGPADNVPHRPMSSASSVASSITGMTGITGIGTQPSHYRMLTSTAAERKRTVAACRALRAQITRFEDAFIQLHGRPPKGATERAPLATTYAQYREWKRAIRADAACRIQALFRGASTRWKLLRSNDPVVSRVVMKRASRLGISNNDAGQTPGQDAVLKELSIPAEIGENVPEAAMSKNTDRFGSPGQGSNQALSPQWGNQPIRVRPGGNDAYASNSAIPKPASSPSGSGSSNNNVGAGDLSKLSLSELQSRKRDLKQQLKQYDMNFARRHGRMPVKAEKEPIRHLYEKYNALKSQINLLEQEGRQTTSPLPASHSSQAKLAPRTISPVGSDSEESGPRRPHMGKRAAAPSVPVTSSPAGAPTQDLSALKAEKQRLHQMLRSYEKDFYGQHKRQVASFADIRPVASQYRRYKEIKKAIAALQQSGER